MSKKLGSLESKIQRLGIDIFLSFWHLRHFRAISLWKQQGPFRPWSFWWRLRQRKGECWTERKTSWTHFLLAFLPIPQMQPLGVDNSKCNDSLLLLVIIFVTNLFHKCIVLCRSYSIFFYKFIALKINVSIVLNKSLPKDFYAMFLTFIEFAMIIVSLILWV